MKKEDLLERLFHLENGIVKKLYIMKKLGCAKCGGQKMAKGGATTNKLNNARGYAKPQTGGSNTKMEIYGVPNAGRTDALGFKKGGSINKMAKGGFPDLNKDGKVTKADILKGRGVIKKIGGAVKKMQKGGSMFTPTPKPKMTVNMNPVKKSKYTTPSRKTPMAQNGGSTKPALSNAPAKIKSGLNSKDQMTVKNISKIIKGGKKYQNGGPTVTDKSLFPGSEIVGFLGAGLGTALAARRQNNPQVQKKQQERIKAREDKKISNKKIDATAKKITSNVMRKGGSTMKYQNGGATKSAAKPKPKPKYVYGEAPGIGGPDAGQAATPGETLMMDEKLAAERKAKAAAAKRKAQATKKGK
jgi:hypothetical protein